MAALLRLSTRRELEGRQQKGRLGIEGAGTCACTTANAPTQTGTHTPLLHLLVLHHAVLVKVDQEDVAGHEAALLDDVLGLDIHHAHLRWMKVYMVTRG